MNMTENLLGIDIGTGSCKCCLMQADGTITGQVSQEYSPSHPKPGWVEQNPVDWYVAAIDCLQQLEAITGISIEQINAVGLTGQMRGLTLLNEDGAAIRPSILWNDQRCEQEVSDLQAGYRNLLQRITHNPLNTMCTLPKLLWIFRHELETWQRAATLLYPKDYIGFRLTGQRATDHSDASGSSFYDLKKQTWSEEILHEFNIAKEKLPGILPSTSVLGTVSEQAHQETGLRQGIPVAVGGSDATVEMLAIGIENQKQCKVRLGTSGAQSTVVDRLANHEGTSYYLWSYLQPGRWMVDINTRCCADSTMWLKDIFYTEAASSEEAYRLIEKEAARAPVGSDGIFFHPYLLGEDAPYWEPHLRGSFFGLAKAHKREHLARAVLEGTGFALRDARRELGELADDFSEHIFVGGGTRNATWLGIVADILGIDGGVAGDVDASYGAAMLGGIAAGVFADVNQAVETCSHIRSTVRHDRDNHIAYNQLFHKYVRLKGIFDAAY